MHFKDFVRSGYLSSRESVEVKFPHTNSTRVIPMGTVGCVDGFTKILCMVGIIACCCDLVTLTQINLIVFFGGCATPRLERIILFWLVCYLYFILDEELGEEDCKDPGLAFCLESLRWVRCAYTHFDVPSLHFLHSLRNSDA